MVCVTGGHHLKTIAENLQRSHASVQSNYVICLTYAALVEKLSSKSNISERCVYIKISNFCVCSHLKSFYLFVCTVSPMIALSPTVVSVIEDQQVTLPCVLLAGNPLPERHWLHDNGLVSHTHTV